jgi:TonB family protein
VAWLSGTSIAGIVLAAGLWRLRRVAAHAIPVSDARWREAAADIAAGFGIRQPLRLLQTAHPALLMTWGLRRPTIILPASAATWDGDRIRVVLAHELAHVRRRDWAIQILAASLRAALWFNPIVWVACRRLRHESEHACDDAVLGAGVAGTAYAAQLLDLARAFSAHAHAWSPALPVARPSGLERRICAMLNGSLNRHPLTAPARLTIAAALLALTVGAAGIALFAQSFATLTGTISDPSGAALPGVVLSATNTGTEARTTVRSARSGVFEFALPPGDYVLEASVAGFKNYRATLMLDGSLVERNIAMEIGTLEETISVTEAPTPAPPPDPERQAQLEARLARRAAQTCTPVDTPAGERPIGGNIRPPVKFRDVRPIYPASEQGGKPGGKVGLLARIGTDGAVRDVTVTSSATPAFDAAAIDAVKQWLFDETLLNCVPVEVTMTVSVTFAPTR